MTPELLPDASAFDRARMYEAGYRWHYVVARVIVPPGREAPVIGDDCDVNAGMAYGEPTAQAYGEVTAVYPA